MIGLLSFIQETHRKRQLAILTCFIQVKLLADQLDIAKPALAAHTIQNSFENTSIESFLRRSKVITKMFSKDTQNVLQISKQEGCLALIDMRLGRHCFCICTACLLFMVTVQWGPESHWEGQLSQRRCQGTRGISESVDDRVSCTNNTSEL